MQFKSLETTPNPNCMKLNFSDSFGSAQTYTAENLDDAPELVKKLIAIDGVNSVFLCNDFASLIRVPNHDWKQILCEVSSALDLDESNSLVLKEEGESAQHEVEAAVSVQKYKGIPMQVKVVSEGTETRVALDSRFNEACFFVQERIEGDFLKERYWDDFGIRYGLLDEIAQEVKDEIQGLIDDQKLEKLKQTAIGESDSGDEIKEQSELLTMLDSEDWHERLGAIQSLVDIGAPLKVLIKAAKDSHPQVRRMVAGALGMTADSGALPTLVEMLLNDQSVGVRRTAGDALSDIGDPGAEPDVLKALKDENKLVRWRAARYLNEVGTKMSLPYLTKALNDKEFEVKLEVEAAIERISAGKEGSMPVWKQISNRD